MTSSLTAYVLLAGNKVFASCSTLELALTAMDARSQDDGHLIALRFTGLTQSQAEAIHSEAQERKLSGKMTGRKFARSFACKHEFLSRAAIRDEWEVEDALSWEADDWTIPAAPESAPAVEVANEYTAIAAVKLGPSTHLQTVNRMLGMAHEVATMLARHESLAPVNVHSHGEIINDLVELTRRAHDAVKAYQLEVQGR